ncbi:conserved hypothetical protein; putative signal peptide [Methylocella silvestris BL2]|uniref:Uncharacterized protein n=1 Tax=Methylocella silvestris (strain DSM 15510 / CIP 108128 / LMG 27833 / NCIMB 13906 / BL2) TaxID=395965 RepID=B8EPN8_METSB|nr:hypothetical protein [Methylocella silvestris]ACK50243.1 conserved hypothetical protein; putative signal peptide [Methylocella silvestris BL2]
MFRSTHAFTSLLIESNSVIGLRLLKLAMGGSSASDETSLMINEKIDAGFEAMSTLIAGGSFDEVIGRYREHVAANADRLKIA